MSEIHKALAVFQLEPGASREAIQRRYRRLSKVWHPDRFESEEDKREAEEELKKINNANDIFKKHFENEHKPTGCECQRPASAGGSTEQRTGPGPGRKKTSETDPEAEARRRDAERQRKAAAEEAARKAAEEQKKRQEQAAAQTLKESAAKQEELKMNKLRWQIAAAEAALFVGLCFLGWAGYGIKQWWHDVTWHWQNDHPAHQDTPPSNNYFNNNTSTNTGYVPPYLVPPTQNSNPYQNTLPQPNSVSPPPSDNNNSAPSINTNPPGFNWKPIQPAPNTNLWNDPNSGSPLLGPNAKPLGERLKDLGISPSLSPSTSTGTATDTTSPLTSPSRLGHNWKPLGERLKDLGISPSLSPNTSTSTGTSTDTAPDYSKYLKP